ncbi:hypothetical protein V494_01051 [Pseudogymnoascus sp. VKM F-4513 (FW-928)]|nr:hypothetical protein V494_01051 [Pseudogymnoascus sp. VKM F-4513 (FW-928)]
MTPRPLRIAILECDTPPPGVQKSHGSYGGLFTALLRDAASSLSPPLPESDLVISAYDVVKEIYPPSLDDFDGILMTGSKHNSFENEPWILKLVEYTKKVLAQDRVRIVGVCFGHQIVGRALGAPVGRSDKGWELSVTDLTLTPAGQKIFGQEKLAIHQLHRDIVHTYPEGVEPLAHTDACLNHAMYIPRRVITIQGHPEYTGDILGDILVARNASGVIDDESFKDAMPRLQNKQDGVLVARAFLRFLLE